MNKTVLKECKYHGLTEHKVEKSGRTRCKKCAAEAVTLRRRRIKLKAVEYLGGKCSCCGYNKCIDALEFHHKDPTQKDFGISARGFSKAWIRIQEELDKCVLLCSNCHRETHYDINKNKVTQIMPRIKPKCPICGKTIEISGHTYCSLKCARIGHRKCIRPDKDTLINDLKLSSFVQVGKKYGVTDNAIRKWLKDYGINPKEVK